MKKILQSIINELFNCKKDWGALFVERRMDFHRQYGKKLITSTWHGADFFSNVLFCLENNLPCIEDEPNGEYKDNFKKLITYLRISY
jgi:hypothetical protein